MKIKIVLRAHACMLLFTIFAVALLTLAAEGQTSYGWTTTEVVSPWGSDPIDDSKYDPSLAVDSSGNVHIAWYDSTDVLGSGTDVDIIYRRREPAGWNPAELISTDSTDHCPSTSLAVDSSGNVHIAYEDWTDSNIWYRRYESGSGWTPREKVSTESDGFGSRFPSLAVDSIGDVHIAWDDWTPYNFSGEDRDIFYKRYDVSLDVWTTTEVVSTESHSVYGSLLASLAVDSSGNVHIAWEDYTNLTIDDSTWDWDIFYKKRDPVLGWTTTEYVSDENSTVNSADASLAVDSSGNVHIAWKFHSAANAELFYRRRGPEGWTPVEVVSTETGIWGESSLAVDSSGNVHIAWGDYTNRDILYRRYESGSGWTPVEVVSTESTEGASGSPSLAVDSSGNVHIAWHDNSFYAGNDLDFDIFYKRTVPAYTLTITTTAGGTTGPLPGTHTYNEGTTVPVTAIPDANYVLDYWELDEVNVGSTNPISVTMDSNHTLHAVFTPAYTLTITTTAGGTTDPLPGTHTYAEGTMVNATADPSATYKLDHWELDEVNVGSTNPISVTMDSDHTLHAVFIYSPSGVGGIIIPVDKFALLAPYVAFAITVVAITMGVAYAWKRWLGKAAVQKP